MGFIQGLHGTVALVLSLIASVVAGVLAVVRPLIGAGDIAAWLDLTVVLLVIALFYSLATRELGRAADFFRLLGEQRRLSIVRLLLEKGTHGSGAREGSRPLASGDELPLGRTATRRHCRHGGAEPGGRLHSLRDRRPRPAGRSRRPPRGRHLKEASGHRITLALPTSERRQPALIGRLLARR
jgi:hypothetical protein